MKKILLGYSLLFLFLIIGLTLALPFTMTIALALGFVYPPELPFPSESTETAFLLSIVLTFIFGLWWIYLTPKKLKTRLNRMRLDLIASKKRIRLRIIGILVAFPVFAFILTLPALFWFGVESACYHLNLRSLNIEKTCLFLALFTGLIWLAVFIGKLCPENETIKRILFPLRLLFTDWVLEPMYPKSAREEREKLYEDCKSS
jgi:hypothetical protein